MNRELTVLVDKYHDAEEKSDDLTCIAVYDEAKSLGYTDEQWKDAYNHCWKAREDERWVRKRAKQKRLAADRYSG